MWIESINVQNCRLLENVKLTLSPSLNVIIGKNASGKTSFLEALSILSTGKSFRTSHINQVITHSSDQVLVSAKIKNITDRTHIGIEKSHTRTKIRINKQDVFSQAELSKHLPITIIHPNSIDIITGLPNLRRSYIDWIAFYLFPLFSDEWKMYRHILKQRNLCLKNQKHRYALSKWTKELVKLQPQIIQFRKNVLEIITPLLTSISTELLNSEKIRLELKTGFPKEQATDEDSLLEFYKNKEHYDIKTQRTSYGVHCADMKIYFGNKQAKECASRGQLKLLAISLLLTQSQAITNNNNNSILLIDDLAAELDSENKKKLLNYLKSLDRQLIITSNQKIELNTTDSKTFHVKHGEIEEVHPPTF